EKKNQNPNKISFFHILDKIINTLDTLPNEILFNIFSYLSWDEILISFWSLNKRFDSLICSMFSLKEKGITFNESNLSYKKFSSTLLPLILNSSSLTSSMKLIHIDDDDLISFDLIYQDIFYQENKINIFFPNFQSLSITSCLLSKPLIEILYELIQYQLNELTLTIIEDPKYNIDYSQLPQSFFSDRGN
ncbi:unnamed protein product, partial [Rotaria sp. Silwood2]